VRAYYITAVAVHHLYKSYSGKTAVKDLGFAVDPGDIPGFIVKSSLF